MRISLNRRSALKGLLGMSAAAVAAQFGVTEVMAEDIQLELMKDVNRTVFAMPGETMLDKQEVWFSVANVAGVWTEELTRQHPELKGDRRLASACQRMARAIDHDLATAQVDAKTKVIVEVPRLGFTSNFATGRTKDFELRAGVEQVTTLWSSKTRIGFLHTGIITGEVVDKARRGLFGLS